MSTGRMALQGQVALITGANTGIGRVTASALARLGARVFIATRSADKTQPVLDEIRSAGGHAEWLALDLGELASVRACAAAFLAKNLPLHLLVNNAGLASARGLTASGFELAFGTNHVGPFLLTQLLTDKLRQSVSDAAGTVRVVTVASRMHTRVKGIDWAVLRQSTPTRLGLPEYGVSKLANVLFSAELGRRLAGTGVHSYALHPGVVASDLWRSLGWPLRPLVKAFMLTPEQGAATTLHCATSAAVAGQTGLYYDKCQPTRTSRAGADVALAAELWRRSEEWVSAN